MPCLKLLSRPCRPSDVESTRRNDLEWLIDIVEKVQEGFEGLVEHPFITRYIGQSQIACAEHPLHWCTLKPCQSHLPLKSVIHSTLSTRESLLGSL
eukprot:scaffold29751_cov25-Tisochrysis_lutea.AAC.3